MPPAKTLDEHLTGGSFRARDFEGRQHEPLGPCPLPETAEEWAEAERPRAEWAAARFESKAAPNARSDLDLVAKRIHAIVSRDGTLEGLIVARIGPHPKRTRRRVHGGRRVGRFASSFFRHTKGRWAGEPVLLEPWQQHRIVDPAFATGAGGLREVREAYAQIAKKNGKTTLAAVVSLYLLLADDEPSAEVYVAATDKNQAKLVFGQGKAMLERSGAAEGDSERLRARGLVRVVSALGVPQAKRRCVRQAVCASARARNAPRTPTTRPAKADRFKTPPLDLAAGGGTRSASSHDPALHARSS